MTPETVREFIEEYGWSTTAKTTTMIPPITSQKGNSSRTPQNEASTRLSSPSDTQRTADADHQFDRYAEQETQEGSTHLGNETLRDEIDRHDDRHTDRNESRHDEQQPRSPVEIPVVDLPEPPTVSESSADEFEEAEENPPPKKSRAHWNREIHFLKIPFQYHVESPSDPYMVAALREALMNSGISPDGIILKSILWKFEIIRTAYKATYINGKGQSCYMKWRVNFFTGAQAPVMPLCDNLATASGRPGGAVVGPPVVIGGVPGTVCCDRTPQKPGCQPGYRVGCQPGKFPVTTPSSIISTKINQLNEKMRGCIAASLIVLVASISVVKCNLEFRYKIGSVSDPLMKRALRKALIHSGVSTDGVILKNIMWKDELIRTAYKATYINGKGESCNLKWRVGTDMDGLPPGVPHCHNVSTGSSTGRPSPALVLKGGIVQQQVPVKFKKTHVRSPVNKVAEIRANPSPSLTQGLTTQTSLNKKKPISPS
ncbi:hypothetical protein GE061_016089 [Apolygus lucorum]|uniref:Uncharacterized protein n=1 Tax=Apolygus lucorum TaxID=248454 RepID=A0A8S9XF62_APOLU|nr:hypothetical protein GE061_016089 [Apolygus lucorum]